MNKKFLSAILFGALMVTSTGTFVSCKDYDDDIDAINSELTDIKSQLAALQAKVDAGKWITSATSTAEGVTITLSDGSTLKITNGKDGKDGAQGAAGQNGADGKDGKNGTVVTVNENGVLCLDGVETAIKVAEEAPAALPCVKVENGELMILQADGTYAASGIKAGSVTAAKVNGLWTITVGEDVITVPGSAAMSYIDVLNGDKYMDVIYAINKKDVEYSSYKKTLKAGLYTTLDRDLQIVVNPQGTDASLYDFSLMNSANVNTELKFKEAIPLEGVLDIYGGVSRATSENAAWILENDFTYYADINEARTKNYLLFKANDGYRHALTLSATSGETTVKTPYDLGASLKKMGATYVDNSSITALVNTVYTPAPYTWMAWAENGAAVYDYWLTVDPSYEKQAILYGLEILDEGHSFRFTRETGINNFVRLRYNYILIDGTVVEGDKAPVVHVDMREEMAAANAITLERFETPLDAVLVSDRSKGEPDVFALETGTYSLDALVAEMSELDKAVWKSNVTTSVTLIGGDSDNNEHHINTHLANYHIVPTLDRTKNTVKFTFYVESAEGLGGNFILGNSYAYTIDVKDADAGNTVATITLPFEFTQPTLDINQVPGEFTEWGTIDLLKEKDGKYSISTERALYVYGPKSIINDWDDMFLPLYDSFTAWQPESATVAEFEKYVSNAKYYDLRVQGIAGGRVLSANDPQAAGTWYEKTLDSDLAYTAVFTQLNTWMQQKYIKEAATNTSVLTTFAENGKTPIAMPYELSTPVEVLYYHYDVYPAKNTLDKDEAGDVVEYNNKVDNDDFNLVFASWLNHSEMEMKEASYSTERGSHIVFLTNDDLNFTTPKGDAFYLFDDISATGSVVKRADKNTSFNEIQQHPFTTVDELFVDANFKAKQAAGSQAKVDVTVNTTTIAGDWFVLNPLTGVSTLNAEKFNEAVDQDKVQIYNVPSYPLTKVSTEQVVSGVAQAFQGGMVIQLPKSIQDGQSVIVTVTVADKWGYTKSVDITVKKL